MLKTLAEEKSPLSTPGTIAAHVGFGVVFLVAAPIAAIFILRRRGSVQR